MQIHNHPSPPKCSIPRWKCEAEEGEEVPGLICSCVHVQRTCVFMAGIHTSRKGLSQRYQEKKDSLFLASSLSLSSNFDQ